MPKIVLEGQKELEDQIKKLSDPKRMFHLTFQKVVRTSFRELIKTTPRRKDDKLGSTQRKGTTASSWEVHKLGLSSFVVLNGKLTSDRKHLLVNILNKGRGEVKPKKAKFLYIPLNFRGIKGLGKPIPKNLIRNQDFILAKKARAFSGTRFLDKELKRASEDLQKNVLKKIGKL